MKQASLQDLARDHCLPPTFLQSRWIEVTLAAVGVVWISIWAIRNRYIRTKWIAEVLTQHQKLTIVVSFFLCRSNKIANKTANTFPKKIGIIKCTLLYQIIIYD